MKMLGVRRACNIQAQLTQQMDLRERGIHAGLVGDAEAGGAAREGRAASGKAVTQSFHKTVLSGKLRKAARQATNREGGRVSPPG